MSDPLIGSQGAVGLSLPLINLGWSLSISLAVSRSTLLRWMELAARPAPDRDNVAPKPETDATHDARAPQTLHDEPPPDGSSREPQIVFDESEPETEASAVSRDAQIAYQVPSADLYDDEPRADHAPNADSLSPDHLRMHLDEEF